MCQREYRDQLLFKDFILPFSGELSGDNRWNKLAELIPWDELEDDYAAQFCEGFGAPAKPFRMALGGLIIKARLGITDEELVEQIKENPDLQFFIALTAFQYSARFDPSMMVYFRKRLPESVVNGCINGDGTSRPAAHHIRSDKTRPNQASLLIDATCVPADIRHSTDLSLLMYTVFSKNADQCNKF